MSLEQTPPTGYTTPVVTEDRALLGSNPSAVATRGHGRRCGYPASPSLSHVPGPRRKIPGAWGQRGCERIQIMTAPPFYLFDEVGLRLFGSSQPAPTYPSVRRVSCYPISSSRWQSVPFLDSHGLNNTRPKCIRLYASADHSTTQRTLPSPRTRNGPNPRYARKSALTVSLVEARSL